MAPLAPLTPPLAPLPQNLVLNALMDPMLALPSNRTLFINSENSTNEGKISTGAFGAMAGLVLASMMARLVLTLTALMAALLASLMLTPHYSILRGQY